MPKKRLEGLAEEAIGRLHEFFKEGEPTGKSIAAARVATAVLGAWTRHEQAKGAEKATLFMIARELAADKTQLAEYMRLTMPDLGLLKALPQPD